MHQDGRNLFCLILSKHSQKHRQSDKGEENTDQNFQHFNFI